MRIEELFDAYPQLTVCSRDIAAMLKRLEDTFSSGGRLYICGNGGSAADAEHISAELLKGFCKPRTLLDEVKNRFSKYGEPGIFLAEKLQDALPAIPFTGFTSLHSAVSNDTDGAMSYAQLVWGLCTRSDALMCISTSGNSLNMIYAAIAAKVKGAVVLALTGSADSALSRISDVCIRVPESCTHKVQELHLPLYHYLCAALEDKFF